ncbi:MAG: Gfo/Idh/MocA family oxidoreductase, partial [Planctomycetaceae bacterium]|nr:Gfo/Idh/MocA family oxidoreductase [Planctomycetaceae bacterium]
MSSRRDFLKTTGTLAAGAALAASFSTRVHAAGSDLIKVALIGCGRRGRGAVLDRFAVGDNVKLVAIADINEERLQLCTEVLSKHETAASKLDLPKERIFPGFDGYKAAIECADQVLVTSFPGFHVPHYEYAVAQGKHVFVEKPFCIDAEGYRRCMKMNKIAEEKGITVLSGFQRRHENSYLEWFKRIQDGAIGDILNVRVYWNMGRISLATERRPGETEMSFQTRDWYVFNWLSGDHNLEQHCHNMDVANWVLGKGDPLAHPVACYGMGGRQARRSPWMQPHDCGNIFDHHYVEFRYEDGSVMHSQCRQIAGCWNPVGELIQGTAGNAGVMSGTRNWVEPKGKEKWTYDPKGKNDKSPYVQEHIDQVDAIRNGKKLHEGWLAATSSMVGVMARMATYSGKEIKWDDAVARGKSLFPYDQKLTFDTQPPVMPGPDGSYETVTAIPGLYDPFEKS